MLLHPENDGFAYVVPCVNRETAECQPVVKIAQNREFAARFTVADLQRLHLPLAKINMQAETALS